MFVTFISCEKEEQINQMEIEKEISNSMANNERLFKKEIVVTDESGKNQAFYAVYSDDEDLLSEYLVANELSLKINTKDIEVLKSYDLSSQTKLKSGTENFDLNQEPKIIVELVTVNLQDNVKSYSLEVNSTQLKSANFVVGYPVGYTTTNNFIGAVHKGYGYEFIAKLRYKKHWYSLTWKELLNDEGGNAWWVWPASQYYISIPENFDCNKRGITIYPCYYQTTTNYRIAYLRNNFRGQFCTIGSYDTANCYVGSAPSGTTAFIYANNFYYTPVSGNQCPLPGSSFDSANCYVMSIPSGCDPFLWSNNWYVNTDIIE